MISGETQTASPDFGLRSVGLAEARHTRGIVVCEPGFANCNAAAPSKGQLW